GAVLRRDGLDAAGRIAAATGTRLMCDTFAPRIERGAGIVAVERIPYFAEQIVDFLSGVEVLILVGSKPPVSFFAYPDKPSWCTPPGCEIQYLAHPHEDGFAALYSLAEAVHAPKEPAGRAVLELPAKPQGGLNQFSVGQIVAALLPEESILADEAATSGLGIAFATATAPPHCHLALTGGSIGIAIPLATGAAVACPAHKVIALQGDGGGMYTLQALWTQARERLDVTTVIFA